MDLDFESVYEYLEALVYARALLYSPEITEDPDRCIALIDWLADNGLTRYLTRDEEDILLRETEDGEITSFEILDKLSEQLEREEKVGRYVTLEDTARMAGVTYAHLRRIVSMSGGIPAEYGDRSGYGGSYRVLRKRALDFVAWLRDQVREHRNNKGG